MIAVQENVDDRLRGAGVVDDLLGEKDVGQAVVRQDRAALVMTRQPLEQKDESVYGLQMLVVFGRERPKLFDLNAFDACSG